MKELDASLFLIEPLTSREQDILQLIAMGMTNKEIADQLSLSVNTIKMYVSQVYEELSVNRRTEAVAQARKLKLLKTTCFPYLCIYHLAIVYVTLLFD